METGLKDKITVFARMPRNTSIDCDNIPVKVTLLDEIPFDTRRKCNNLYIFPVSFYLFVLVSFCPFVLFSFAQGYRVTALHS